jgi:hypothetical protein
MMSRPVLTPDARDPVWRTTRDTVAVTPPWVSVTASTTLPAALVNETSSPSVTAVQPEVVDLYITHTVAPMLSRKA